jgi:polar amino acid transport system permease protein
MFEYDWNWSVFLPYWLPLLRGVVVTIEISALSAFLGTALGFVLASGLRIIPRKVVFVPLRALAFFSNDVLRAIPILVLLYVFYYFPYKQILGVAPVTPFEASVLALALSQAAFTADLVYSAVDRVNPRTILAAQSLGIDDYTIFWNFTVPDIIRQTMPAQIAFWIGIVKLSSFASVIGCQDVVYVASVIGAEQYRSIEVWVLAAVVYVILVVPSTMLARTVETSEWMHRR